MSEALAPEDRTAPSLPPSFSADTYPPVIGQKKIFAKPFRLCFKRVEDQVITWIEVKTVTGLKNVVNKLANGEIVPVNAAATLDRQLWGILAEHIGFIRYEGPSADMHVGIQPLGAESAALVDDMSSLFGGFEPAIEALAAMREQAIKEINEAETDGPSFLKEDGVNLTPEGEKELASQLYDSVGEANVDVKMETANAEILLQDTDAEVVDPIAEIRLEEDLESYQGYEADVIGRKVERAAEGDLEDEEEID